jgi:hypothetical protein
MVMPCSRSAERPSTSSAKSMSCPWVPMRRLSVSSAAIFADQGRFAIVHAAAGDEAQHRLGAMLIEIGFDVVGDERFGAIGLFVVGHQK